MDATYVSFTYLIIGKKVMLYLICLPLSQKLSRNGKFHNFDFFVNINEQLIVPLCLCYFKIGKHN